LQIQLILFLGGEFSWTRNKRKKSQKRKPAQQRTTAAERERRLTAEAVEATAKFGALFRSKPHIFKP